MHASKSGVAHFACDTEEDVISTIKELISYIPQNNREEPPFVPTNDPIDRKDDRLNEIIPDSPNEPYDMYEVINAIVDDGKFFEVQPNFAKNIIVGFARFNGQSVGIVANQPKQLAGVLDCNSTRTLRQLDYFRIVYTLENSSQFIWLIADK